MTAVAAAPGRTPFLLGLNPLAKIAAALPAMIVLVFVRDLATPAAFVGLAYLVLLTGARWSARLVVLLGAVVPLAVLVVTGGFALWVDSPGGSAVVSAGSWILTDSALAVGWATGLRLAAIMMLAFIGGLTSTGPDLVRALVQQLRVPYRIGYAALAAIRFVPRFGRELDTIRQAHRVRGVGGFAPTRWIRTVVPLLAGGIRHAERVALAMDARAFGAYPDRTERHLVPWRPRDTAFVLAFWAVSAAVFVVV